MSEHICPAGVDSPRVSERLYEREPGVIEVHCYCEDCASGWFSHLAAGEFPAPPPEPVFVVSPDGPTSVEEG